MIIDKIKQYLIPILILIIVIFIIGTLFIRFAIFKEMVDRFEGQKPEVSSSSSSPETSPVFEKIQAPIIKIQPEIIKCLYIIKSKLLLNINYKHDLENLKDYLSQPEFNLLSLYAHEGFDRVKLEENLLKKIKILIINNKTSSYENKIFAPILNFLYKNIFIFKTNSYSENYYYSLVNSFRNNNFNEFLSIYDSLGEDTKTALKEEHGIISGFLEINKILDQKFIEIMEKNDA